MQSVLTHPSPVTNKENHMANDPFRTEPVYPNKKKPPQKPIPARRG